MCALRLYNTLSRKVEQFTPRREGEVGLYVCGPTVYDVPHVGNARPPVVFDVLVRHLRASGYRVTYVRNITDVDDKILDRARERGEDPVALSARLAPFYQSEMKRLGCLEPTHEPKVSEHVREVVELIQEIIAQGGAYEVVMPSGAHDVYFAVRSFGDYGKLSRRKLDELEVGARVERDESKRDPLDFALWKGTVGDAWGFDSPWGRGRPGWHIECSAMSARYLGHGFDIHGGGMDLIFPHHENEIAQSEAAHPHDGDFCHLWMHNGFINVNKEKMSKSLGNVVHPTDIYRKNDPEALRYLILSVQYRGPLALDVETCAEGRVSFPGVDEAERRVDYFYSTLERIGPLERAGALEKVGRDLEPYRAAVEGVRARVTAALDDDLNTPVALAHVGELAKASNDLCDLVNKRRKDAAFVEHAGRILGVAAAELRACTDVLGLLQAPYDEYAKRTLERRLASRGLDVAQIEAKVAERTRAREEKDWKRADLLRAELLATGVEIADTASGVRWSVRV